MLTVAKYDRYDLVNTPGDDKPCFTVWFSGCSMGCSGCHNPLLLNRDNGTPYEVNTVLYTICHECEKQDITTVVLLGGEPMEQNFDDITMLASKLKSYGYNVWLYTGWEFEDIPDELKHHLYTIKCGKYDEKLHVDGFPASSNQRILRKSTNGEWVQITL